MVRTVQHDHLRSLGSPVAWRRHSAAAARAGRLGQVLRGPREAAVKGQADSLDPMAPVKRVYGPGELAAFVAGGGPATDDDVSITNDGRRLDSAEAVLEFLEDLRQEREAAERSA